MGWLTDLADNAMADGVPVAGISGVNMQAAPRPAPLTTAGSVLPPLSPASEGRHQKLLAILTRDGRQYAILAQEVFGDMVEEIIRTDGRDLEAKIRANAYPPFIRKELEAFLRDCPPSIIRQMALKE
jgi:hypothetical protein